MNVGFYANATVTRHGIYDQSGRLIESACRTGEGWDWRDEEESKTPFVLPSAERKNSAEQLYNQAIFLGWGLSHFGHFWVESLSRFWSPWRDIMPYAKPLMRFLPHGRWNAFPHLEALVRSHKIEHVTDIAPVAPFRVAQLFVPDPFVGLSSFGARREGAFAFARLREWIARAQGETLADWDRQKRRDLFLSRETWDEKRPEVAAADRELQRYFRDRGWDVIVPETLNFNDQVKRVYLADRIAGIDGSQLHLAAMMKRGSQAILIHGPRRDAMYSNYETLNVVCGIRTTRIRASEDGKKLDFAI